MTPNNPFAVLRLPANATAPEIKSAGQLALARLRLSDPDSTTAIREIESAIEQLRDPVKRFRFGLEWPSLGPPAAKLLATHPSFFDHSFEGREDRRAAIEQLMEGESPSCKQHIWAVFMLLHAQETFSRALAHKGQSLNVPTAKEIRRVTTIFLEAIKQWNCATTSPQFWMEQRIRAKEINDPRVNADLITSCEQEAFAIAIDSFAALASTALRLRNAKICTAIVEVIKTSGANDSKIDGILSEIYKPICARMEAAIATLQRTLNSTKSKSAAPYEKLLAEYVRDIQPDIALILIVGDLPGTTEERCRDAAAEFLRSLSVESANNANAYEIAKKAVLLAQQTVDSAQLRNTLDEDSNQINKLETQSETLKIVAPIQKQLEIALKANDFESALQLIDRMMVAAPLYVTELTELRRKIADAKNQGQKSGCLVPLALATTAIALAGGSIAGAIFGWNVLIG
jgi:hypothetical protein